MKEWRAPTVVQCYDAFSEPPEWDRVRSDLEHEWLVHYVTGINDPDELLEAMRHVNVDLLEAGHYPSRYMLRMIAGELKSLYWPDQGSPDKERTRSREWAWLANLQAQTEYLAATKYRNERHPRPAAERAIAKERNVSAKSLRRTRNRYRKKAKKAAEALRQRRKRYGPR